MALEIIPSVYKITCVSNNNVYVGSSVHTYRRWLRHRQMANEGKHHCAPLQAAWAKYGESAFDFCVLEVVRDRAEILVREQCWMDQLAPEFNVLRRAGNMLGMVHSEATRQRIREAHTGREVSAATRARISIAHKGKVISESHKAALRKALTGKKLPAETVAKMSASRTGKPLSDAHKQTLRVKALERHAKKLLANTLVTVI